LYGLKYSNLLQNLQSIEPFRPISRREKCSWRGFIQDVREWLDIAPFRDGWERLNGQGQESHDLRPLASGHGAGGARPSRARQTRIFARLAVKPLSYLYEHFAELPVVDYDTGRA
jgi:hypothetical protein